ncbi:MAG TPA: hypothetical protein DDW52_03005 [Planctomycetaceae bacterium]|nr:hypothetical protein [Planctomycetaceae bacterium]
MQRTPAMSNRSDQQVTNPYAAPSAGEEKSFQKRTTTRVVIALLNFVIATLLAIACVVGIIAPESAVGFLSALVLLPASAFLGFAEWTVLYHSNARNERTLAYINAGCAVCAVVGVISTAAEVALSEDRADTNMVLSFSLLGLLLAAYFGLSSWSRLKWTGTVE